MLVSNLSPLRPSGVLLIQRSGINCEGMSKFSGSRMMDQGWTETRVCRFNFINTSDDECTLMSIRTHRADLRLQGCIVPISHILPLAQFDSSAPLQQVGRFAILPRRPHSSRCIPGVSYYQSHRDSRMCFVLPSATSPKPAGYARGSRVYHIRKLL